MKVHGLRQKVVPLFAQKKNQVKTVAYCIHSVKLLYQDLVQKAMEFDVSDGTIPRIRTYICLFSTVNAQQLLREGGGGER